MLNDLEFDKWAKKYETDVELSNKLNSYPFAGYTDVLKRILDKIPKRKKIKILDVGCGTGYMTYFISKRNPNINITCIDFSEEMLKTTKGRVKNVKTIKHDISNGIPKSISNEKFDFIISTYAFHHFDNDKKIELINLFKDILNEYGKIIIGDIAFKNLKEKNECENRFFDIWDSSEDYIIFENFEKNLKVNNIYKYIQISFCAGLLEVENDISRTR